MTKRIWLFILALTVLCGMTIGDDPVAAFAETRSGAFVPDVPTLSINRLRAGSRGYMLTVLRGTKPERIPVEIVSVVPQKGRIANAVLIRTLSRGGTPPVNIARGMSGSPVYVDGRLIGAVGSGWELSDHTLALVTPIDDMCGIFERTEGSQGRRKNAAQKADASFAAVSGLSERAADSLGRSLGISVVSSPTGSASDMHVSDERFRPGDSIAVLLAWGDVDLAAAGTVSAVSKDGRFLAFAHPFLKRGNASYPAAKAYIHETVQSVSFPFKLASASSITGTITRDCEAGLGGITGVYAKSIPAALVLKNRDTGERIERNFRVVQDDWLSGKLLEAVYGGLIEDAWGRTGQGSAKVTLRIEGKGIENGWTRSDMFASEEDIGAEALKQSAQIISAFLTQPFADVMPAAFRIEAEITEDMRALIIEDVKAPESADPGEELSVSVTLRPWRGRTFVREMKLRVPEDAEGTCELVVRGGGVYSLPQLALEGGWKSIDSLGRMMSEIAAADANSDLIAELISDSTGQNKAASPAGGKRTAKGAVISAVSDGSLEQDVDRQLGKAEKSEDDGASNLLPEESEYLSETKARRIGEGTLKILSTDRFVSGMIRRIVTINDE